MKNYRYAAEEGRVALREILLGFLPEAGRFPTPIEGFALHRYDHSDTAKPHFYNPILIVAVQGKKWVRIGINDISFGEHTCFIAGVNMPVTSCLLEATPEMPYLSMSLDLDRHLMAALAAKTPPPIEYNTDTAVGAAVQELTQELLDAFLRMIELLDQPEQAKTLGALIYQEIHYRLLATPFGHQLRLLNSVGSQSHKINQAILWLRENYREALQVDKLAATLNMASSTLYKNFKEVTTLSPLQYQKRLRLDEAQRLMLVENCDVIQAALMVGYESANQFSREYKRLFGEPPRKNVVTIRTGRQASLETGVGRSSRS
ncbi:AraC family transcriptional regulator [Pseudomonas sp. MH9.3]|uniref:AraC family transcriptional regulator n=1 Tax=Pseudomonas sp. MH9.3 TaxID=3048630 RepID=UPI002AC8AC34|nr:AraC family transcriptional regulator [Pseudomonas sp. MH9.3]MEB0107981.1 AraC family transcriptional regulator [Pseudomonas sp. MH9.3]WPX80914.1 AraC family transcriptional regulator [Pseudomonas sp. MH9.3]WQG57290.1 AraC family transcriptional regulator [Pseudomonas sp. RTB3]